jgi:hypothetical protein
MASSLHYKPPGPLKIHGSDIADNWNRFKEQWDNYEVATGIKEESAEKRGAIFLTCIGTDAYDVYRSMEFETGVDKKKIDVITTAFKAFCVGNVNVTYERYVFNKRTQENGESFDIFLGDLRRMARSCQFEGVCDSMIRDRIVVGVRDDATRHKLLQQRDLTLARAIDICKASEAAARQLRVMTSSSADEVNAAMSTRLKRFGKSSSIQTRGQTERRDTLGNRKCRFCCYYHEPNKEDCPAFGKECRRCNRRNHFEAACTDKSSAAGDKARGGRRKQEVCAVDDSDDEELLTVYEVGAVSDETDSRWYTRLSVDGRTIRFLLDSGATCNIIPAKLIEELGRSSEIRPPTAKLLMFEKIPLQIGGMATIPVKNIRTGQSYELNFYVATRHEQAVLGRKACCELNMLKPVHENICEISKQANCISEEEIVAEFPDLFEGIGRLEGTVHFDVGPSVPPVQIPLRRIPLAAKEKVAAELRRLEAADVIALVTTPAKWVSALLVVAKGSNGVRLCLDPKELNKALIRTPYCMPTIQDILPQLQKVKVMSSVDAKDGFLHCVLDEETSLLTTMETPFGRYRWKRLPYGTSPSPEIFQAKLGAALSNLRNVACIADDILIFGTGDDESEAVADHNANLRALLLRCRQAGIKLNRKKLQLNRKSMVYCGHLLECGGVRPDPRKIDAIRRMPAPTDRKAVMRLLGMATYVSKFCPNFSDVTEPLRALIRRENEFVWREDTHGRSFERLKQLLCEAPSLNYYDVTKPVTVQCDSSRSGLGCVIMQDGRPVEYASRALTNTEQNYAQIEKELLAILFALELVIAIPDHFRNPGISGLKTRNPGINPGIGISNVCGQARSFNDFRQGLL